MGGPSSTRNPGRIGRAALGGAAILLLLGLAGIALGIYAWAFEEARPSSGTSGGVSFAWVGYTLAAILVVVSSPLVGVGTWILARPAKPAPLGIGGAMATGYGLVMLWLGASSLEHQRGRAFDEGTAIPFVIAVLFLLAALMLGASLLTTEAPTEETPATHRSRREEGRWRDDRVETPPPGYGTRRP
jgi:hypothetical protein